MNYLHSNLLPLLEQFQEISAEEKWDTLPEVSIGWPEWQPGDVVVTNALELYPEHVKVFFLPVQDPLNDEFGPALATLIEHFNPSLETTEAMLELGAETLEKHWDSQDDLDRLKRFELALWKRHKRQYDRRWIKLAKIAHTFGFKTVQDFSLDPKSPPIPLYQSMGYDHWSSFAKDALDVHPNQASQLKWIWEIYHVKLGWTPKKMLDVGKSKMTVALGSLRREFDRTDGMPENIKALVEHVESPKVTFAQLFDKLRAGREGGVPISFAREDTYDPQMVYGWLHVEPPSPNGKKEYPEMVHVSCWFDKEFVKDGMTVLFGPELNGEQIAQLKLKLGKSLRWDKPNTSDQNTEDFGPDEDD